MKRIRAVMLVILLITMTAIPVFNISAGAEETTETPTESPSNVFVNVLKKGNVEVTKAAEDGLIENISFQLYGTSDSGISVDLYAATNEEGKILFEDIPIGTYTLTEASVPDGYVIPEDITIRVIHNKTIYVTFTNILEKGSVQLIKADSENTDIRLSGAEFAIFKDLNADGVPTDDDELVGYMEEVTTGLYVHEDLPYGSYFIKETKAPEGYNLDSIYYPFVVNSDIVTVQNREGFFVNEKIEEIPTQQPTTTPQDTPQTGQKSNVLPLTILALISAGVIVLLIIIKKRNR